MWGSGYQYGSEGRDWLSYRKVGGGDSGRKDGREGASVGDGCGKEEARAWGERGLRLVDGRVESGASRRKGGGGRKGEMKGGKRRLGGIGMGGLSRGFDMWTALVGELHLEYASYVVQVAGERCI